MQLSHMYESYSSYSISSTAAVSSVGMSIIKPLTAYEYTCAALPTMSSYDYVGRFRRYENSWYRRDEYTNILK